MNISVKILFLFITLCYLIGVVYAGALITEFKSETSLNQVTLKWKARAENNLKEYEIERSIDGSSFDKIGTVKAADTGNDENTYSFEDRSVYKETTRSFHYRLKILDEDEGFSYSKTISVTPKISNARFTWGSIKAMFR